jgi:hypothetical protein
MRYTVVWLPVATAKLAMLWNQASDRQAVADAADRLDIILRDDPESKGRPVGTFFAFDAAPLSVLYRVDPADRMVTVVRVMRI